MLSTHIHNLSRSTDTRVKNTLVKVEILILYLIRSKINKKHTDSEMNFKKYESKKRLFEISCQMYSDKDGNAIVNGIKRFEWNTIFI